MLHPLVPIIRRKETSGTMPEWVGVGMVFGGLLESGWMFVSTISRGAWVVGLTSGVIFVTALFVTIGYLFPEVRR